ncbi:MAG: hypothetical protein KDD50_08780 [Bdellovibrionales bacterium]|nr:hypothetical protein [Bdellovibrionales bacterium]
MTKNYTELDDFVQEQDARAKAILDNEKSDLSLDERESEAVKILKKTLRMIFSRPDKDSMVQRILPDIRRRLTNLHSYDDTIEKLANECVYNIKSNKMAPVYISTCIFILENIMSEIKPTAKDNKVYKQIMSKIIEADLEVPRKVRSFRRMRGMFKTISPSETAKNIMGK